MASDAAGQSAVPPQALDACAGCQNRGLTLLACDDPDVHIPGLPPGVKPRFCADCMIGKKVRVFWPVDNSWYAGTVQQYDPATGEHLLKYDDNDTEWVKIGESGETAPGRQPPPQDPPQQEAPPSPSAMEQRMVPQDRHSPGHPPSRLPPFTNEPPPPQQQGGSPPDQKQWQGMPPAMGGRPRGMGMAQQPYPPPYGGGPTAPGSSGGPMYSAPPPGYGMPPTTYPPYHGPSGGPYHPPYGYPQVMSGVPGGSVSSATGTKRGSSPGSGASAKRKSGPKAWTKEEDALLLSLVKNMRMPMKWSIVAQSMPERTGKQCRERYVNHLNPRLKVSDWSPVEDATIFHLYNTTGSHWAKMSKMIPGRTDNGIKNRFHNLRRQLEREDEHRMRLSKAKDFPGEIRLDRLREFPTKMQGRSDELWDMRQGIGIWPHRVCWEGGLPEMRLALGPFINPPTVKSVSDAASWFRVFSVEWRFAPRRGGVRAARGFLLM